MADEFLNADLSKRVFCRTTEMEYTGKRGKLLGKPMYIAGGKMEGAVTVMVHYVPNSDFEHHEHPQGEEIFVVEGVFCDKRGNHEAGCYLFNPEGFDHQAHTDERGNLILIRLRQYPNIDGVQRTEKVVDSNKMEWVAAEGRGDGVVEKLMYPLEESQSVYPERQWIEKWEEGCTPEPMKDYDLLEIYVLDGEFTDSMGTYIKGDWLRLPKGSTFDGKLGEGQKSCTLLIKSNHLAHTVPEQITVPEGHVNEYLQEAKEETA